jgi:hypothetical protein
MFPILSDEIWNLNCQNEHYLLILSYVPLPPSVFETPYEALSWCSRCATSYNWDVDSWSHTARGKSSSNTILMIVIQWLNSFIFLYSKSARSTFYSRFLSSKALLVYIFNEIAVESTSFVSSHHFLVHVIHSAIFRINSPCILVYLFNSLLTAENIIASTKWEAGRVTDNMLILVQQLT